MFLLRKYKMIIFIAVMIISTLIMIAYNLKYDTGKSFLRKIVLETVSPVYEVLSGSIRSVQDAWLRYILLIGIQEENRNLKKKINELKAVLVSYQEGYQEAQRLKKLLAITDHDRSQVYCCQSYW